MPRKRRGGPNNRTDLAAGPGQPSESQLRPPNPQPRPDYANMPYGRAGELETAAAAMPMPTAPTPGGAGGPAPFDMDAVMADLQGIQPIGFDDEQPAEPGTAGLRGPVPGITNKPTTADTLARLAAIDPSLGALVELARRQGS